MQKLPRLGLWVLVSLCCLGGMAPRASASVLRALKLDELAERADRIVLGRVEKLESRWTDDHSAIFTEVTLVVERTYKGPTGPGERLVVRREGGSVAGIGMRVFGAPEFSVGEETVIFTEQRGRARFVSGMAQGKLELVRDAAGRERLVWSVGSATLLGQPDERLLRPLALDDFERLLVKVLDQVRGGR